MKVSKAVAMVELRKHFDVESWLAKQPKQVAVVLAVRCALRVAPLMALAISPLTRNSNAGKAIVLPWFSDLAALWVVAVGPTRGAEAEVAAAAYAGAAYAPTADAYTSRAASAASRAAAYAAAVVRADDTASAAAASAAYAADAASAADIYSALSTDANALEDGVAPEKLALSMLWPAPRPQWAGNQWRRLKQALNGFPEDENWWVCWEWYEARLKGGPVNRDLETKRVLIANELWQQGPKVVNAEIARLIEEARANLRHPQQFAFFLSYSKADDAYARWITSLLTSVGITVFAQFKDIPPGSNFAREMQHGLENSRRLIALLSPDYETSDDCRSEFSAFYNKDPGGARRLLVPLMIRPSSLDSQVVYQQLVGLSREDAAKAILEAIGYRGEMPPISPNFPGTATIEEIGRKTGGVFQVAPGASGLLERQPIQPTDSEQAGFTPADLFATMAEEIACFADHLANGNGNFKCSDRLRNRAARLQSSVEVGLVRCDPLEINKNLVWVLRVIALDKKDGAILPNDEIEYYVSDLYGYYQRLEFVFPQLKAYRKIDAQHRFVAPDEHAERAIREVYASFGSRDASREALSPDLTQEFKRAGEDIENAKTIAAIEPGQETKEMSAEAHADAATKSMSVWGWLASAREKFEKSGQKAGDIEKTIASYEKLYKRVSPDMADYIAYLLKWFL